MPSSRWRVVRGRLETMLTLAPTRALTRVDLPTLGRPMTATWPARCGAGFMLALYGLMDKSPRRSGFHADRKSTRLNSVTNAHLVCGLLLERKKYYHSCADRMLF